MRHGLAVLVLLLTFLGPGRAPAADDPAAYTYSDTRALVSLVDRAAALVAAEGEDAFKDFAEPGSDWFTGQIYFFAYDLDGVCIFHAASPDLVGRNLIELEDINGKPVIRFVTEIGHDPASEAAGWVFYLWQEGTQLSPDWKSAYVRKVTMPGGKVVVLGSGLYDMKIERVFVERRVDRAVELLRAEGTDKAYAAFRDPATAFTFLDTYVFVLDEQGRTIVDPAFPNEAGRDLSHFRDAVGLEPVAELLDKLATDDSAWVQYLWRPPGQSILARKLIYARKVTIDGKTLIVGSDYVLATPIWMKVEGEAPWRPGRPA